MILFYMVSLMFASASFIRLTQDDCMLYSHKQQSLLIKMYDNFIICAIGANMTLTFLFYFKIIIYVYSRTSKSLLHMLDLEQNFNNKPNEDTLLTLNKKLQKRIFPKTKHWRITVIFLKVHLKIFNF